MVSSSPSVSPPPDIQDSFAIDLGNKIHAEGSLQKDINLFAFVEPDKPDDCLTLYDSGGESPGYYSGVNSNHVYYPRVEIRVRGNDAGEVVDQMNDVLREIERYNRWTRGQWRYKGIFRMSEPSNLPRDDAKRYIRVVTVRTIRDQTE